MLVSSRYRLLAQQSLRSPSSTQNLAKKGNKRGGRDKRLLRPFVIVSVAAPWHPTENTAKPIKTMSSSRSGRSLVEVRERERWREYKSEKGRWGRIREGWKVQLTGETRVKERGNGSINQSARASRMRVAPFVRPTSFSKLCLTR